MTARDRLHRLGLLGAGYDVADHVVAVPGGTSSDLPARLLAADRFHPSSAGYALVAEHPGSALPALAAQRSSRTAA